MSCKREMLPTLKINVYHLDLIKNDCIQTFFLNLYIAYYKYSWSRVFVDESLWTLVIAGDKDSIPGQEI